MKKRRDITSEELDILSEVWILSCNDETPEMTYESIKYRLELSDDYDIKRLIQSRRELFRHKIPEHRLESWKIQMRNGRKIPSWIKAKSTSEEQEVSINSLTRDDVFRNQIRLKENAPRASLDEKKWGLEYIEGLRQRNIEKTEKRMKKLREFWIPLVSALTALVAVLSGAMLQIWSIDKQNEIQQQNLLSQQKLQEQTLQNSKMLKFYEIELSPKQSGYSTFMKYLNESYENAYQKNGRELSNSLYQAELAYYSLEPFLKDSKNDIWVMFNKLSNVCLEFKGASRNYQIEDKYRKSFDEKKDQIRQKMFEVLFKDT